MEEKNESEFTKDGRKRNFAQKVAFKIALILKKILRVVFGNPIPWVIITAIVFGRFYELGYFGISGATVKITGVCEDFNKNPRPNLAEDQVVVSTVSGGSIEGVIRKTREYVKCDLNRVAVDRIGTIKELFDFGATIAIPEITEQVIKKEKSNYFQQFINKDLVISGTCLDPRSNRALEPFIKQVVSITNIKESQEDPGSAYFYGVREDKQAVVCDSRDITYEIRGYVPSEPEPKVLEPVDPLIESLVGKKVFLTALCLPDYRVYRVLGKEPTIKNYNLQKTPVEVVEEERDSSGKIIKLVGSVLAKSVRVNGQDIPVLGHKIRCEQSTFPMIIVPSTDTSVKIEESESAIAQ